MQGRLPNKGARDTGVQPRSSLRRPRKAKPPDPRTSAPRDAKAFRKFSTASPPKPSASRARCFRLAARNLRRTLDPPLWSPVSAWPLARSYGTAAKETGRNASVGTTRLAPPRAGCACCTRKTRPPPSCPASRRLAKRPYVDKTVAQDNCAAEGEDKFPRHQVHIFASATQTPPPASSYSTRQRARKIWGALVRPAAYPSVRADLPPPRPYVSAAKSETLAAARR